MDSKLLRFLEAGGGLLAAAACAAFVALAPARADETDYAGSAACKRCHAREFESWAETLHARMMRRVTPDDAVLQALRRAGPPAPFRIEDAAYVLGNIHRVAFLLPAEEEGRLVVAPQQYDPAASSWEPVDLDAWELPGPGRAAAGGADWNARCAGCHTTAYEPAARTFAEPAIGCEACHGPGAAHARSKSRADIVNPAALPGERANHVCARCHSRGLDAATGTRYPARYRPGDDLAKTFAFEEATPGVNTPTFWANGVARVHHAQYNEMRRSKHAANGVRCFDCHAVHRFRPTTASPETTLVARTERFLLKRRAHSACLTCHTGWDQDLARVPNAAGGRLLSGHTRHPPQVAKRAAESTLYERLYCWECHMPLVEPALYATRAHTFAVPSPGDTAAFGAPNGCGQCHEDRGPTWAKAQVEGWRRKK